MPEIVESLLRPTACIKELIGLGWILWVERSLGWEAVSKVYSNITELSQAIE